MKYEFEKLLDKEAKRIKTPKKDITNYKFNVYWKHKNNVMFINVFGDGFIDINDDKFEIITTLYAPLYVKGQKPFDKFRAFGEKKKILKMVKKFLKFNKKDLVAELI